MGAEPDSDKFAWLLGRERYQRLYLQFWLMTTAAYVVILLLLQFYAFPTGMIRPEYSRLVWAAVIAAEVILFVALRSGWSKRFEDPALTVAQMIFALSMVALVYVSSPKLRGTILLIPPLILLFGAFSLHPVRCRQMGIFTIMLQVLMMGFTVSRVAPGTDTATDWINFFLSVLVNVMVSLFAGRLSDMRYRLRNQKKELNEALKRNLMLVRQDSLTGLPNRRHAMELLANEEQRALRQQVALCVCMLDIDHFKHINDTYGHAAGDDVLCLFASHANGALRSIDVLTRWGGEEFLLLMPHMSVDEAIQGIERVRREIAKPEVWQARPELQVTFSAGVAALAAGETVMQTVARADEALYAAKQNGRNCTAVAPEPAGIVA
jgi:diguanylate cyclase (GGDEF)-like protein